MKLSSREKKLIIVLIFVGAIFLYYKFIFLGIKIKKDEMKTKKINTEEKYNKINNDLKEMDSLEEEIKSLVTEVNQNSMIFYNDNEQEKIIIDLDKIIKTSNVKGALKFKDEHIKIVNSIKKSESFKNNEGNEKETRDNYENNSFKKEDSTLYKNALKYRELDSRNTNINEETKNDKFQYAVTENEVDLEFSSSYENYYKLLKYLNKNEKVMGVKNAKLEYLDDGKISGNLTVIIYSIPKI